MKLYTEEQIAKAVMFGRWGGTMKKDYQEFLNSLTPIELPNDEEIKQDWGSDVHLYFVDGFEDGFEAGAKWVIEKIKQQIE